MSSLFVMVASFWMKFWEYKIELFWCLSLTEETESVVISIADDVWGYEDELTGVLNEKVEIWD